MQLAERGDGEVSSQGQQRARNKGKAKVQDSWCAKWVEKAEACRREKEESEERARELEHRRRAVAEVVEAERKENERVEQEALFRQQCKGEGCPQEGLELEEVIQRVQGDEKASPKLRAVVIEAGRFLADWGEVREEFEGRGIPIEKAWLAHIANRPEAARSIDPELRVELDWHLPNVVHGSLVPCRICDQHKALRDRWAEWDETRKALRRAAETEQCQRTKAEARARAQIQAEQRRRVEEQVAAANAARRAEEEARQRLEREAKAEEDVRARAREERSCRIEAQAVADREVQRGKEKESGGRRPLLLEVTIEEEEEAGVTDPELDLVRSGVRGVSDQEVRRWASPPDQKEEQQVLSPQGWGEIHWGREDSGEQALRARLLSQHSEDIWIEQTTARLPHWSRGRQRDRGQRVRET
jgi:hypothetical protein